MADASVCAWHPTAAYLYVLGLDGPALAWEYLRRNPDYRQAWIECGQQQNLAARWGLRALEDPGLDARQAQPDWFPDHQMVIQLFPDHDPPPRAQRFAFWQIPGHRRLFHDGKRMLVHARWPGRFIRMTLAAGLADGGTYLVAFRASADSAHSQIAINIELDGLAPSNRIFPTGLGRPRPNAGALLELHSLQALDARLAGASLRQIAVALVGEVVVADQWHADGALRSRVRRLVRRGERMMRSGYRKLAQLD